ncbi:MAG TPA: helix-turn-helix transcriptional regulator [Nitrospirota bacterium]|nr:helix-turn-helix transcriptional regulator [Nitrospirota bacterium]
MSTEIGQYLKKRRERNHMTLRQVEQETGIKNAYLSQLENGKIQKPSPEILHKLAGIYSVPYAMLMEMVGYPTEQKNKVLSAKAKMAREFTTLSHVEEDKLLEYLRFLRSQKG